MDRLAGADDDDDNMHCLYETDPVEAYRTTIRWGHRVLPFPANLTWKLERARRTDPGRGGLERVVAELNWLRARSGDPDHSYPERVATLALWTLNRQDLIDDDNRCGAAWAVLLLGMRSHHWALTDEGAATLLLPHARFFDEFKTVPGKVTRDDDVARLARLLRRTHLSPRSQEAPEGSPPVWEARPKGGIDAVEPRLADADEGDDDESHCLYETDPVEAYRTTLRWGHLVLPFPAHLSWNLDWAKRIGPDRVDLERVVAELNRLKAQSDDPDHSYPERVATLGLWTLNREDLIDDDNRCGAAWTVLLLGMQSHHWALTDEGAGTLLLPRDPFFFDEFNTLPDKVARDDDVARLARLLRRCHRSPTQRRRQQQHQQQRYLYQHRRWRELLDRKRKRQERMASELQRRVAPGGRWTGQRDGQRDELGVDNKLRWRAFRG